MNIRVLSVGFISSFTKCARAATVLKFKSTVSNKWFRSRSSCIAAMSGVAKVFNGNSITKSAADSRQYRGIELSNGLRVLLISDPETDKSSAAMDIHVGHLKDPFDIPGLAHFCEHMLFLGTEKYPQENEYNKYLNENGGMSNAYTSLEHTNYYFDVSPDHLNGALDRFAQFFLCPLFTPSATEREVNAVDSENSRNLQSDPWRLFQLDKSLAKPRHDYSKFGTGNKDTLETQTKARGLDVRDELLKFHSTFYSSNIMGFCVLGKESLDELQAMVVPLLEQVPNKNVQIPFWDDPPYTENELKKIVYAVPVKDIREMSVAWPTPDLHDHYQSNPGHYLGHLLGHEGSGSLLSELKSRGWANTLVGGQKSGAKGFSFFSIAVDLTDQGQEHIEEIIHLIYQYVCLLKCAGSQEWIYRECQELAAMAFNFKDKESPRNYTSGLASKLHEFPMTDVLSAYSIFDSFDPALINMILDKLVPANMRVTVVSKKFEPEANQTEKWYGTQYKVEDFTTRQLKMWESAKCFAKNKKDCTCNRNLHLPMKNDFIPSNFDLVERDTSEKCVGPEIVKNTSLCRLWYKQDDKFLKPKACISLDLISPMAYMDPLHTNMTSLFTQLFDDALTEYSYMADIAGLRYGLENSIYGLTLSVKGYNDKMMILLEKILEKMSNFEVDPARLEIFKETHARHLKNFQAEQPHQHAIFYTNLLMSETLWTKDELLEAIDEITAESLQAFIPQLLSRMFIEGLVYGNVTKSQSLCMMDTVESILKKNVDLKPLLASQNRRLREVQLPDGCCFMYEQKNVVHESSSIEVYYQCGMQNTQTNMLLELFCQVIGEPCFNILRTQEQLGYIVFSGVRRSKGVQGVRVIVQSNKTPEYVEGRIEAFLHKMREHLQELSDKEFEKHRSALATKRLEKPKKLMIQNNKYWTEIISSFYNFDRDNEEVTYLKTLTKEELIKFYEEFISLDGPKRHKLSVRIASEVSAMPSGDNNVPQDGLNSAPQLPEPVVVNDVVEFKRDLCLYPLPKPVIDINPCKSKL